MGKISKHIAVCATSTTPLRELTCHMGSHCVTCYPAEVTFPPLPQPIKAGTRFSDPGGMQGWFHISQPNHQHTTTPMVRKNVNSLATYHACRVVQGCINQWPK